MKRFFLLLFIPLFLFFGGPSVRAEVPFFLHHQGRILDGNGNPLSGTHQLTFRLYGSPSGGSPLWSETVTSAFQNGYYSVQLGANTPLQLSVFKNKEVYLGITVGTSGQELKPRTRLVSVPYALLAKTAENIEGGIVNAKEIRVGGKVVITDKGEWKGPKAGMSGSSCSIAKQQNDSNGNVVITFKCGSKTTDITVPRGPAGPKGADGTNCQIAKTGKDNKGNTVISFKCGSKVTNVTVFRGPQGPAGTAKPVSCPPGQAVVKIDKNGNAVCGHHRLASLEELPFNFEEGFLGWNVTANSCQLVSISVAPGGTKVVENLPGKRCVVSSPLVPVNSHRTYTLTVTYRARSNGAKNYLYVGVVWYTSSKSRISWSYFLNKFSPPDFQWRTATFPFGRGTYNLIPRRASYFSYVVWLNDGGSGARASSAGDSIHQLSYLRVKEGPPILVSPNGNIAIGPLVPQNNTSPTGNLAGSLFVTGSLAEVAVARRNITGPLLQFRAGDYYSWYSQNGSYLSAWTPTVGDLVRITKSGELKARKFGFGYYSTGATNPVVLNSTSWKDIPNMTLIFRVQYPTVVLFNYYLKGPFIDRRTWSNRLYIQVAYLRMLINNVQYLTPGNDTIDVTGSYLVHLNAGKYTVKFQYYTTACSRWPCPSVRVRQRHLRALVFGGL